MNNNRRLWIVIVVVLLMLLALVGFFLWLTGGQGGTADEGPGTEEGLVHVRTIYVFDGNKNLVKPTGIGSDDSGNFFVTLRDDATVVQFDRAGDYVQHFGERGLQPGNLMIPLGVATDPLSGHIYVVDRSRFRLVCYDTAGEYLWEVTLLNPLNVTVGPDGDVYVLTFGPIVHLTNQGELVEEVGTRGFAEGQFDFPRAAAAVGVNRLVIADTNNTRLQQVEVSGELTATVEWVLGEPPLVQDDPGTRFRVPSGVTLDERGRVVVLDGFRHVIEMIDPETLETFSDFGGEREGSGDGRFGLPTGITRLYGDTYAITDTYNDRVQIVRLIAPEDMGPLALYPWLKWLLLLLLLPLAFLFGRKRAFATEETLARAVAEGKARVVLGVYRKLYVLPEVADGYADVTEGDVRLGDYLVPVVVEIGDAGEADERPLTAEERLAEAARPSTVQRLMLARHRVVCVDEAQYTRIEGLGRKPVSYDELVAEYALADETGRENVAE
jgi:hypothetical protein